MRTATGSSSNSAGSLVSDCEPCTALHTSLVSLTISARSSLTRLRSSSRSLRNLFSPSTTSWYDRASCRPTRSPTKADSSGSTASGPVRSIGSRTTCRALPLSTREYRPGVVSALEGRVEVAGESVRTGVTLAGRALDGSTSGLGTKLKSPVGTALRLPGVFPAAALRAEGPLRVLRAAVSGSTRRRLPRAVSDASRSASGARRGRFWLGGATGERTASRKPCQLLLIEASAACNGPALRVGVALIDCAGTPNRRATAVVVGAKLT